ncbi:hypothetical protein [Neolewinella persica]|uniref:hypothetical protein n=1 Tax=Neolewinella persica TaxID=70998 RepID=UPI00039DB80D|nr:hypothetical protein [Neolewinella persica]
MSYPIRNLLYQTAARLFFLLLLLSSQLLAGQPIEDTQRDSPRGALTAAFEKANLMVALSGVEWRPGLNMAVASLETGKTISLNVSLLANTNYVFIATTTADEEDTDLYLRDSSGAVIGADKEPDATPIIEFRTDYAGTYQLQVHLVSSRHPREFVAVCLLRAAGRSILESEYREVATSFFNSVEDVKAAYSGTNWLATPTQWCAFGYSLSENEGISIIGLRPGPGPKIIAATGSRILQNIDLYLANETQRIIAMDNGPDAFPLISYDCPPGSSFDLRVEVERGKTPAFLLVGILERE